MAVVTTTLPLAVRLMTGTQVQIARELEESSRVHGANWFQTFFHIVLGLIKRGFMAGWVIVCVDAIRNLGVVVLLFSAASMPISVMIFVLFSEGQTRLVSAMAVMLLMFIISLLVLQMRLSEDPQDDDALAYALYRRFSRGEPTPALPRAAGEPVDQNLVESGPPPCRGGEGWVRSFHALQQSVS